ncbi:T9SS type A sorting domain-containing protein, partial [Calditrichota bacterium]
GDLEELDMHAKKRGYLQDHIVEVEVEAGETTTDIDFYLWEAEEPPVNISATQGINNRVVINWDDYNNAAQTLDNDIPVRAYYQRASIVDRVTGLKLVSETKVHRDGSDEADWINIYRSYIPGGPYAVVGRVDGDDASFTEESNLFPGKHYYYVVTADFGDGETRYSEEVEGWTGDEFLEWEADLPEFDRMPEIDGILDDAVWQTAIERDISDVYGYDIPDSAGSVIALMGYNDEEDKLIIGVHFYNQTTLDETIGVGIYVDEIMDGRWNNENPGSEGNYWAYLRDDEPDLRYRSLSGGPWGADPFFTFEDPELAYSLENGYVQAELALQMGFKELHHIAVYAPDYEIGLALFTIRVDENDQPHFTGWWPQDVLNIVSSPRGYAPVKIPIELLVPPRSPSDLSLSREGDSLMISWVDPDTGMDNAPIFDFEAVQLFRNGEYLGEELPGVEEYLDDEVAYGGWYEYRTRAYIDDSGNPFSGPFSEIVGIYAGQEPDIVIIAKDDSTVDAYYVVAFEGEDNRFAAKFEVEDTLDTMAVYSISFITNDRNAPVMIGVAEDDGGMPGAVVGDYFRTTAPEPNVFHTFKFPGIDQPKILHNENQIATFWVVARYFEDYPGEPAFGVDNSSDDAENNQIYRSDTGWQPFQAGQLMFRVGVGSVVREVEEPTEPLMPTTFRVGQNYPNPFNSTTLVPVDLPTSSNVSMIVFDLFGRELVFQNFGLQTAGFRTYMLNSNSLVSGTYLLRVNTENNSVIKKIQLIK